MKVVYSKLKIWFYNNFMRCWLSRGSNTGIEVVGINVTSDPKTCAHLLKYDSILGQIKDAEISHTDNTFIINGKTIKCFSDMFYVTFMKTSV